MTDIDTNQVPPLPRLREVIASLPTIDTSAMGEQIVEDVLRAESFDEAFADTTTGIALRDSWLDRPITITECAFADSTTDSNIGKYALIAFTEPGDGTIHRASIGGAKCLAQLAWACVHSAFPITVRLVEVGTAQKGQSAPLGFVKVTGDPTF